MHVPVLDQLQYQDVLVHMLVHAGLHGICSVAHNTCPDFWVMSQSHTAQHHA